jgi:hypothetical protein
MLASSFLACAVSWGALSVLAHCSPHASPSASASKKQRLTPRRAKQALLEMMRSKWGKRLRWFKGTIPDQMARFKIEKREGGWYTWTGAFHFHPAKATYTFIVRPRPRVGARVLEYTGSFVRKHGHWSATPPKLVSAALQPDE